MNGINVIIIGVFQEDLPQNPGECKHLSNTTLRAKETISIGSANSKEKNDHLPTQNSSSAQVTSTAMPPKHFSLQTLEELVGGATPVCAHIECKISCKWNFPL